MEHFALNILWKEYKGSASVTGYRALTFTAFLVEYSYLYNKHNQILIFLDSMYQWIRNVHPYFCTRKQLSNVTVYNIMGNGIKIYKWKGTRFLVRHTNKFSWLFKPYSCQMFWEKVHSIVLKDWAKTENEVTFKKTSKQICSLLCRSYVASATFINSFVKYLLFSAFEQSSR